MRGEQPQIGLEAQPVKLAVSPDDMQSVILEQPGLSYDADRHRIIGTLEFSAEYDQAEEWLTFAPQSSEQSNAKAIHDTFDIEIRLDFQPSAFNPWPPVIETAGRIQRIMEKHRILDIADMHCYPDMSEKPVLLGYSSRNRCRSAHTKIHSRVGYPLFLQSRLCGSLWSPSSQNGSMGRISAFSSTGAATISGRTVKNAECR